MANAKSYLKKLNKMERKLGENNKQLSSSEQKIFNAWKAIWEWKSLKPSLHEELYWKVKFKLDEEYNRVCRKLEKRRQMCKSV